jgi:vancomycin resistance protein YoaR
MTNSPTRLEHQGLSPDLSAPRRNWISPLLILLALVLIVGSVLSYQSYRAGVEEAIRVSESIAFEEHLARKAVVEVETFYEGISIEGIDLGGKTFDEATALIAEFQQKQATAVSVTVSIDSDTLVLDAAAIGWSDNRDKVLAEAFAIARSSTEADEVAQIADRYEQVMRLASEPVDLSIDEAFDRAMTLTAIQAFADPLEIAAKPAVATGFDVASGLFDIAEQVLGRRFDLYDLQDQVISQLSAGVFQIEAQVASETVTVGLTASEMQNRMGLLGSATTYANAVDPPRDNNLARACAYISGTVIQPGETFSFNKVVGRRTLERGFLEAGVISDGTLIKELGGGICQITTTTMQAAMMSDYQLVERYPHSWPSSYTQIGLDATVDWGGVDLKFKNNTDLPLAVVASYDKPRATVKLYGRKLANGVTISLRSTHDGYIDVEPPIYRQNNTLMPGQVREVRTQRIGQRSTAYKVYHQNGEVIRETVLFRSYYRPIQGIYEVGPKVSVVDPIPVTTPPEDLEPETLDALLSD